MTYNSHLVTENTPILTVGTEGAVLRVEDIDVTKLLGPDDVVKPDEPNGTANI